MEILIDDSTIISFSVESSINVAEKQVTGIIFHPSCWDIFFETISKNEWKCKFKIIGILKQNLTKEEVIKTAEQIRERILSIFIILSKSDAVASDEIFIKTKNIEETLISRTDLGQTKKLCSVVDINLKNSKLMSLKENEWDFLNRYSKTFLSLSKQEKISKILSTIDIGGKIEIKNNSANVKDQVTERMKYFLTKIGVPRESQKSICDCRHDKDHENKYIELPKGFDVEDLRRLIYPYVENMVGLRGFDMGINLGDSITVF